MRDCIYMNGEQWVRLSWYEQRGQEMVAAADAAATHAESQADRIRELETACGALAFQLAEAARTHKFNHGITNPLALSFVKRAQEQQP